MTPTHRPYTPNATTSGNNCQVKGCEGRCWSPREPLCAVHMAARNKVSGFGTAHIRHLGHLDTGGAHQIKAIGVVETASTRMCPF